DPGRRPLHLLTGLPLSGLYPVPKGTGFLFGALWHDLVNEARPRSYGRVQIAVTVRAIVSLAPRHYLHAPMEKVMTKSAGHVRPVIQVTEGQRVSDGAGVHMTRMIGTPKLRTLDPFLMLDFFSSET